MKITYVQLLVLLYSNWDARGNLTLLLLMLLKLIFNQTAKLKLMKCKGSYPIRLAIEPYACVSVVTVNYPKKYILFYVLLE